MGTEYGRFCGRYVDLAVAATDLSQLREVGIDETSCRCGHDDITVVFVTEGKDSQAVADFAEHPEARGGKPEQVLRASIDLLPAFLKGVRENLPKARITFDKFHFKRSRLRRSR